MRTLPRISLTSAFLLAASMLPANAALVNGGTPCAVITNYLDQNNKAGIDSFVAYAIGEFRTMDAKLAAGTGRGIFDLLTVGQINNTTAIASMWCSTHPSNNARDAAAFAYDGATELGVDLASAN